MSLSGWLLLLVVLAVIGVVLFRRRVVVRPPRSASRPTLPGSDDLTTLGLSEVRARSAEDEGALVRPSGLTASGLDRDGVSAPRPASREASLPPRREESQARPRPAAPAPEAGPFVREGTDLWPGGGRAAGLLLASLSEQVGGPAAVLRLADDVYAVEAFAGKGPVPEPIDALGTRLHRAPQDLVVTLLDGGTKGGVRAFGTYGAYVRALAEPPAARVLLVVGLPEADPAEDAAHHVGLYADLLAEITALPTAAVEASTAAAAAPVPRAAIIEAEQAAAAEAGAPLAFALVTLAEAEDLLTRGTPEDVAAAEAALRDRLEGAPDVRRVEPFGDLLFGAFLNLGREATAAWCDVLASDTPPLFIGAVAPAEGEPQAIRDAATEALRDAYDQQRTQVVEV